MSDSSQEVRALLEDVDAHDEELRRLKGSSRTRGRGLAGRARNAPPSGEGPSASERQNGGEAGGTAPRGPIQPYSAAEIAERALRSEPGNVPFDRQFGAETVSTGVGERQEQEPDLPHHPHQERRGDPRGKAGPDPRQERERDNSGRPHGACN